MFDIEGVARAIIESAHFSKARTECKIDISTCTAERVKELFDSVIEKQTEYGVRIRGVRSDWSCFQKLGLKLETASSGSYKKIPIVLSPTIDFDSVEFVVEPA